GGSRWRVCLVSGAGRRELDFALGPADLLDPHFHRVAEPVRAPAAAPDQCRAELAQLEVVARQPPRREEALEHLREADEQARRDQARDLAVERRLPAELEQPPLEQPRETDLVREVLVLRGRALPNGGVLGELGQILWERLV